MVVKRKQIRGPATKVRWEGEKNTLDGCMYCPGEQGRTRKLRKKLKDTPRNRSKENSLFKRLAVGMTIKEQRHRRRK